MTFQHAKFFFSPIEKIACFLFCFFFNIKHLDLVSKFNLKGETIQCKTAIRCYRLSLICTRISVLGKEFCNFYFSGVKDKRSADRITRYNCLC